MNRIIKILEKKSLLYTNSSFFIFVNFTSTHIFTDRNVKTNN